MRLKEHSVNRAGNYFLVFTVLEKSVCTETCVAYACFLFEKLLLYLRSRINVDTWGYKAFDITK